MNKFHESTPSGQPSASVAPEEPKPKKKKVTKEKDPLPTPEEVKSMPKCPDFPVIWPNIEKLMAFYNLSREDAAKILVQIHGPEPMETTKEKETATKGKKPAAKADAKNPKDKKEEPEIKGKENNRKSALRNAPPKPLTAAELKMDAQPPRADLVAQADRMEEEEEEEEGEDDGEFWPPHPSSKGDGDESDLDGEELDEVESSTSSGGGPPKDPPPRGGARVPEVKTTIMDEMQTLPLDQPEPTLQHIPTPEPDKVEDKDMKEEIKKVASPMKAGRSKKT